MSAPNQGRQSPEPERQTDAQMNPHGANPNKQGGAPSQEHGKEQSDHQKSNKLESNPKGPLEDAAAEKTSKQPYEYIGRWDMAIGANACEEV
ncbi:hypothetical protein C1H76_1374 [Elsinoe australis]|uniref:Uncharacterized protein n=1 Tax=Elsinoe australis TaxID=40998 RepID=A0A4V6DV03_9PEZI|nr:hypothetical protein C1H76_1374 [Elsinoe australis]